MTYQLKDKTESHGPLKKSAARAAAQKYFIGYSMNNELVFLMRPMEMEVLYIMIIITSSLFRIKIHIRVKAGLSWAAIKPDPNTAGKIKLHRIRKIKVNGEKVGTMSSVVFYFLCFSLTANMANGRMFRARWTASISYRIPLKLYLRVIIKSDCRSNSTYDAPYVFNSLLSMYTFNRKYC